MLRRRKKRTARCGCGHGATCDAHKNYDEMLLGRVATAVASENPHVNIDDLIFMIFKTAEYSYERTE